MNKKKSIVECLNNHAMLITAIATALLVIVTGLLVWIGCLQKQILDRTDETSRLRDRAFVYFLTPTFRPYPPNNPTVWAIEINMANAGNMPARGVSIKYKCIVSKNVINDPFSSENLLETQIGNVIGPKQPVSFLAHQGPFLEVKDIVNQKLVVYVVARVEYKDGFDFGKVRVTEMSRRLYVDASGGYSFQLIGPHNCSDQDCSK
jgi:hypothetical protein